jgi:hypothetical protein
MTFIGNFILLIFAIAWTALRWAVLGGLLLWMLWYVFGTS